MFDELFETSDKEYEFQNIKDEEEINKIIENARKQFRRLL